MRQNQSLQLGDLLPLQKDSRELRVESPKKGSRESERQKIKEKRE